MSDTPPATAARIVASFDTPRVALLNAKAVDIVSNLGLIGMGTETIRCAFAGNPGHRETPPTLGDRGRPGTAAAVRVPGAGQRCASPEHAAIVEHW